MKWARGTHRSGQRLAASLATTDGRSGGRRGKAGQANRPRGHTRFRRSRGLLCLPSRPKGGQPRRSRHASPPIEQAIIIVALPPVACRRQKRATNEPYDGVPRPRAVRQSYTAVRPAAAPPPPPFGGLRSHDPISVFAGGLRDLNLANRPLRLRLSCRSFTDDENLRQDLVPWRACSSSKQMALDTRSDRSAGLFCSYLTRDHRLFSPSRLKV